MSHAYFYLHKISEFVKRPDGGDELYNLPTTIPINK